MSNTLKKITARAKQLRSKHPGKKWTTYVKEAGKEYRAGKIGVVQSGVVIGRVKKRRKKTTVRRKRRKVGAYKFIERNETKSSPVKKTYRVTRSKNGRITKVQSIAGMKSNIVSDLRERLGVLLLKRELNTKAATHHKLTKQIAKTRADIKRYSK